jgi:threonine dehydratase
VPNSLGLTVLPRPGNSTEKNAAMRELGARLIEIGSDFDEARAHALALAEAEALTFAPSFHADLVVGVATWALELFRTAPALDVLYAPIGLGSGICGAILARCWRRRKPAHKRRRIRYGARVVFAQGPSDVGHRSLVSHCDCTGGPL